MEKVMLNDAGRFIEECLDEDVNEETFDIAIDFYYEIEDEKGGE